MAIIEPAVPDPLSALIESGELRPARVALPMFSKSEVSASDSAGLDVILEDRYGADRW